MKNFVAVVAACAVVLACVPSLADEENGEVSVFINEEQVIFPDAQPIIQDGRTLIPLRALFEEMGADVYWSDAEEIVCIAKSETKILLKIGEEIFFKYVCGDFDEILWTAIVAPEYLDEVVEVLFFDVSPQLIGSNIYISLRCVCEAMGMNVDWDGEALKATIKCSEEYIATANKDKTFAEKYFAYISDPGGYEEEFMKKLSEEGELPWLHVRPRVAEISVDGSDVAVTVKSVGFDGVVVLAVYNLEGKRLLKVPKPQKLEKNKMAYLFEGVYVPGTVVKAFVWKDFGSIMSLAGGN